jgi:glutamate racemase
MSAIQTPPPANAPIGVFDSGVGGLTVLKILADHFPEENFLYLGDTARVPYGSKSPETIRRYSLEALQYLVQRGVKTLVIACNSASSQVLEKSFQNIPVENVIEPGAAAALVVTKGKVGVLATRATVNSKMYEKVLLEKAKVSAQNIEVYQEAAPLLVPLAEEGWIDDPITNLIAFRHVQPLLLHQIDTLILGCTHYPILKNAIQKAVGPNVRLIDSGEALAQILHKKIKEGSLQINTQINTQNIPRTIQLLATESSTQFEKMAEQILGKGHFDKIEKVEINL